MPRWSAPGHRLRRSQRPASTGKTLGTHPNVRKRILRPCRGAQSTSSMLPRGRSPSLRSTGQRQPVASRTRFEMMLTSKLDLRRNVVRGGPRSVLSMKAHQKWQRLYVSPLSPLTQFIVFGLARYCGFCSMNSGEGTDGQNVWIVFKKVQADPSLRPTASGLSPRIPAGRDSSASLRAGRARRVLT